MVTAPPRLRAVALPPPARPVAGAPVARVPVSKPGRAPKEHVVGKPPNPRKPQLVRDIGGNELKDLFAFFPDLPRPARPSARLPARRTIRRR
jgi:hypothetical protein